MNSSYIKFFIVLLLSLCFLSTSNATHIIGGSMSYACLGNDEYRITIELYRDCFGGQASFDDPLRMRIYTGPNGNVPFGTTINVNLEYSEDVPPNTGICAATPGSICVERGIYKQVVTLPFNPDGYHVSYQRCCRNNSISNLVNPQSSGATYTVYISDEAQQTCNNSPTFEDYPPIIVCASEDVGFSHSATDAEGDVLVYTFCAPFLGGSISNPTPDALPPPYSQAIFLEPYTAGQPLGDMMTIDAVAGNISGTPNALGQFVAGVCVEEYRVIDGVQTLLSLIKREFQLNVVMPVDVESPELSDRVNIFPNPANDMIQIDISENTNTNRIEIFDTLGKQIFSVHTDHSTQIIPVSEWTNGIYFVFVNGQSAGKSFNY